MTILGIHHMTAISADAQRTVDFYVEVLGQRLVKQTVNFDAPDSYHLYFGDQSGRPGTVLTFFEWPGAGRGRPGVGGTHHVALETDSYDTLLMWKRRLTDLGLAVDGPFDRHYFTSIYFRDPDGLIIEIATRGPGWTVDEEPDAIGMAFRAPPAEMLVNNRDAARIIATTWPEPVPQITPGMALRHGMHHLTAIGSNIDRTHAFFGELLGMRRVKMTSNFDDPDSAHWYWGVGDGRPGTLITYFERDPHKTGRAVMGAGQMHHFALTVANEDTQLEWREKLLGAGLRVSQVMDRVYFKSIYTSDPDGHIIELATAGPGFLVDEDVDTTGTVLQLPPWLEARRTQIAASLTPLRRS
ncbi:MAG TPA: VOC family protein [Roseiflexaceae bacterium]|nr:VOC family protein [Roseiflexaceae bacterium]HMP40783.1 VOC family protein [Roseiflexaceae bacterium]